MAQINTINLDAHPRGDSGLIRWSWVKKNADGSTTPISLVGYRASFTCKSAVYDDEADDSSAVEGYENALWKVDVDCDDPDQMHGIDPATGMCMFEIPKQATWTEPGQYNCDIVVENKSSHRTTTCMVGTITVQGHPTNRLTTDYPDTFDNIGD